ncbi:unnamed protein product [Urochloa decumbens]|uniref:Uncharacterized protein n=1 Tax=Urochloa decumbens TaxID=240449 RepID=A0ABC8YV54_9POAL
MDWKDQAKPMMQTKFSSCRGVSFELNPSPGSPFALEAGYHYPPQLPRPDATSAGGRWVWLPQPFSRGPSRMFPAVFGMSPSLASSHFCDLDDDDDDPVIISADEEKAAVAAAAVAVGDGPGKNKATSQEASSSVKPPAPSERSRLGVILLDQGLFTVYKRLFALCAALNAVGLALAASGHFPYARAHAAAFAMGNILALTLCRSEAALRVVFWLAVAFLGRPWVPVAAKTGVTAILQSLGGVHSGCGVSSLVWLAYALARAICDVATPREIVGVASAILGLLVLSCLAAFPLVRHLHHNVFERTHRFAGWAALALLWAFVVLSAGYDPATASYDRLTGAVLVKRQELWLAAAITFFTFLPWLTVRRVPVTVTARSTHASETHAMFAGAVGDFTRALISDPPTRLWVRGVHFAGLPYLLDMYTRATMVATGSGICVFMSFLMQPGPAELSLVWVAKGIEANYGEEMKAACTGSERLRGRVIVHDTAVMGRPNVAALAVHAARRWGSEVVVVTSNPEGSRDVVTGCNKAGIPAFGPIWDS